MRHITLATLALATATLAGAYSAQAQDISAETRCLIDNVFHEARGEPLKGRILVASVTLSRVKAKFRGQTTICGVVYDPYQFSWTKIPKAELKRRVQRDRAAYDTITEYVLKWQRHGTVPITDVVHYARHEVNNYWTQKMSPVTQVGAHVFYAHNL